MPKTQTVEEFSSILKRSNLLDEDQFPQAELLISNLLAESPDGVDAHAAAKAVARAKLITRWQASLLLAGTTGFFLGRYKLLSELGRGGMGAVYKAEQQPLGRQVALKLMSPKMLKNQPAVDRFNREIQAAAALNHRNIVAAFDADQVGKVHFLVMEYVEGKDLSQLIKPDKTLPEQVACDYIRQAALGLQHAHDMGMCHRDIKPANLLIVGHGTTSPVVKILDMGLARFTSESEAEGGLTQTGQIMGTPDYISPEQARDTHSADIRSDVYSLGCSLFRILTGKVPFNGDSFMAKLLARSSGDPPLVSSLMPHISPQLDQIVARMMALDPAARFSQPAEVAQALAPFAEGYAPPPITDPVADTAMESGALQFPDFDATSTGDSSINRADSEIDQFLGQLSSAATDAAPTLPASGDTNVESQARPLVIADEEEASRTPRSSVRKRSRSDKRFVWIAAAAVIGSIALGIGLWLSSSPAMGTLVLQWRVSEREAAVLEINEREFKLGDSETVEIKLREGQYDIKLSRSGYSPYEAVVNVAPDGSHSITPEWIPTETTIQRLAFAELESATSDLIGQIRDDIAPNFPEYRDRIAELRQQLVSFSVDHWGSPIAEDARQLSLALPSPFDELKRDNLPPDEVAALKIGTDIPVPNELVMIQGSSRLVHSTGVISTRFVDDDKTIFSCARDGLAAFWDARTGELKEVIKADVQADVRGGVIHPDGDLALIASYKRLEFMTPSQTSGQWQTDGAPIRLSGDYYACAISPNRELFATYQKPGGDLPGAVLIWSSKTREPLHTHDVGNEFIPSLTFSDDNTRLLIPSHHHKLRVINTATGELVADHTMDSTVTSAVFLPGSHSVLLGGYFETNLAIFKEGSDAPVVIPGTSDSVLEIAVSSDGSKFALGLKNGTVEIWDTESRTRLTEKTTKQGGAGPLAFSNDGRQLSGGLESGAMFVLDVETNEFVIPPANGSGYDASAAVSPDLLRMAIAAWDQILIVRVHDGVVERTIDANLGRVLSLAFIPGTERLAASGTTGVVRIFNYETGSTVRSLTADNWLRSIDVSADGKLLAAGGHAMQVTIWDLTNGKKLHEIAGHQNQIWSVAFSPDGKELATCCKDRQLHFWDTRSGRKLRTFRNAGHRTIQFTSDGKTVLTAPAHELWSIGAGRQQPTVPSSGEIADSALVADGTWIAAAQSSGSLSIGIWEQNGVSYPRVMSIPLTQSFRPPCRVSPVPDGRHVMVLMQNGTVHIYRIKEW